MDWSLKVSAPAVVLIGHGLVDQETLDSLPSSGKGSRGGLKVARGRARVKVEVHFFSYRGWRDGDDALRRFESRNFKAIAPFTWSPKAKA